jgi:pyrroline-5-carboxylate reductase
MSQVLPFELGILGAGNMAEAITRGILGRSLMRPDQILAADVAPQRREFFQRELGVRAVADNAEVARQSRRLLLSVKPQQMQSALAPVGAVLDGQTLVLSIAAAVSTSYIEKSLGPRHPWHVVRAMPNTPMLVGEGTVALAPGARATAADVTEARRIFESAAQVIELP